MIRVLIVEDQAILRESLARSVGDQPDMIVVSAIADASEALGVALKERPDMILMDVCTEHDSNGIVAAARIKEQLPECRIIIMTGMPEITFVDQAREAGVDKTLPDVVEQRFALNIFAVRARPLGRERNRCEHEHDERRHERHHHEHVFYRQSPFAAYHFNIAPYKDTPPFRNRRDNPRS